MAIAERTDRLEESRRAPDDSFADSLWSLTGTRAVPYASLKGAVRTQAAVVGAGYTGLCAALELARRGLDVIVLEAHEPGYGASGRNGGQVIPLFKFDPDDVVARYGEDVGRGILDLVDASADVVFEHVDRYGIACEPNRSGWVQAAHSAAALPALRSRYEQLRRRGLDVEWLDNVALVRQLGTGCYAGGWLHRHAGSVQPLSYARGLARAAAEQGVIIHGATTVKRLEKNSTGWLLIGEEGQVQAERVVLAGNAYTTALWPDLRQSVVPLHSMQVATDPLPADVAAQVLPSDCCVSDTRRVVRYYRKDQAGRFVIGTRGPFTDRPTEAHARALVRSARELYPALEKIVFRHRWAGRVAMTTDHVPHLHRLAPGVWSALGYNGRGVAMASMLGKVAGAACAGERENALSYPVSSVKRIPFHAFHRLGVAAVVTFYRLLDQMG